MLDKPISESANRLLFVHKIIKHIVCPQRDKIKKNELLQNSNIRRNQRIQSLKMLLYKVMSFIVYICMCLKNTFLNQQIQTKLIKCLRTKNP